MEPHAFQLRLRKGIKCFDRALAGHGQGPGLLAVCTEFLIEGLAGSVAASMAEGGSTSGGRPVPTDYQGMNLLSTGVALTAPRERGATILNTTAIFMSGF